MAMAGWNKSSNYVQMMFKPSIRNDSMIVYIPLNSHSSPLEPHEIPPKSSLVHFKKPSHLSILKNSSQLPISPVVLTQ